MNMTIQMLRAFKAAAQMGSFTRAAEKCFMTQPAFSRLIAAMEENLGVRLFERTTRRITLTSEGEMCLKRVNQMLDAYDLMHQEMELARHSRVGNLRVGYNPVSGPPQFLLQALRRLSEEYPGIHVTLVRSYSGELVEMLDAGKLDCALVSGSYFSDTTRFEIRFLQPIYLYALVRRDSSLARLEVLRVRDLKGIPMVFMANTAPRTRNTILKEFEKQGITPTEDEPVVDLEDMIMRVRIGSVAGMTSFGDPNGQYPDVVAKKVEEFNERKTELRYTRVLAWKKGDENLSLKALNEILDKEAEKKGNASPLPFD